MNKEKQLINLIEKWFKENKVLGKNQFKLFKEKTKR